MAANTSDKMVSVTINTNTITEGSRVSFDYPHPIGHDDAGAILAPENRTGVVEAIRIGKVIEGPHGPTTYHNVLLKQDDGKYRQYSTYKIENLECDS